ncbi:hypothetical protein GN958_ATG12313 [Phytophthora infestans]|uniref:Uncharacterized protein n=1 Tax=Phytophthora infestans TaxID=4787 RepID=A0A8S9UGA7_PHYIN|nr:hypothetical protein GN958_ATG12313 [Phytophthora infestans]
MATSKTMELVSEPNSELSIGLVGGEVDVAANSELEKGVQLADAVSNALNSRPDEIESTRELGRADLHESDGHGGVSLTDAASSACNLTTSIPGSEIEASSSGNLCVGGKQSESSTRNDGADVESVVGTRGSSLDGNEVDDDDDTGLPTDDDITVASVFSFDEKTISMENNNSSSGCGCGQ